MTTKQCNTCKKIKQLSEFGINRKKNANNFHAGQIPQYKGDCKPCLAAKAKAYRDSKPGLWKKYRDGKSKNGFFPKEDAYLVSAIRTRITSCRTNNKRSNRPFELTDEYMYKLWQKQAGLCALTGKPMLVEKAVPNSLSIDKKIPELGYVPDNVQWVTIAANRAKSDLSMEELLELCKDILETCRDYP